MTGPQTPAELFEKMSANFNAEAASGMNTSIQFDLSGDSGGTWSAAIADGKCEVAASPAESPTLTLAMDANDFMAMSRGELDPTSAFMQGKIKLQGDMGLAMKIGALFGMG